MRLIFIGYEINPWWDQNSKAITGHFHQMHSSGYKLETHEFDTLYKLYIFILKFCEEIEIQRPLASPFSSKKIDELNEQLRPF